MISGGAVALGFLVCVAYEIDRMRRAECQTIAKKHSSDLVSHSEVLPLEADSTGRINIMQEDNSLVYDNVWESLFGRGSEKAKDWKDLSQLVMKYDQEVQLFFGTPEELRYLKELKLQELERQGVEVIRD
jgi:hypothetical protein